MKRIFTIFFLTLLLNECLLPQTIVPGGNVSGSWTQLGSPYLINGDITISYDDTLTIEAGVYVIFQDNYGFLIQGDLIANGTISDSVCFTVDDTTGYYNNTHKGWRGLSTEWDVENKITLNYCIIEFSITYCISAEDKTYLSLYNSHLRYSFGGVYIGSHIAIMNNLIISNNRGHGIIYSYNGWGSPWQQVQLNNFIIRNNTGNGIITCGYLPRLYGTHGKIISNKSSGVYVGSTFEPLFSICSLVDVIIEKNGNLNELGGGIHNLNTCFLDSVYIRENIALNGGGIFHRYGIEYDQLDINNSVIEENIAVGKGGGICVDEHSLNFNLYNSIIRNNQASLGGGLYINCYLQPSPYGSSTLRLRNTEISANYATNYGGGIYLGIVNWVNGLINLSHITIVNNIADNLGSGIYCSQYDDPSNDRGLSNSIIWNNHENEITDLSDSLNLSYCDIEDSWPGTGNIEAVPLFVNPVLDNYGLMWANYPQEDYTKSPCIDSGDPTSPIDPDGTNADMGAYCFNHTGQNMIDLDVTVFLEGPFENDQMISYLNSQGLLPLHQPYFKSPWNHYGYESVDTIQNNNIIDWIFVELRIINNPEEPDNYNLVSRQVAFLMNDGKIRSINGSLLSFYTSATSGLYICIFHRNHLPVISSNPFTTGTNPITYDFSLSSEMAMGGIHAQNEISPGVWGMIAADGNNDGQVENKDKNEIWLIKSGSNGYYNADFSLDGQINTFDLQKWGLNAGKGNEMNHYDFSHVCGIPYTDKRNGKTYKTVQIGSQCWMAENLNIGIQNASTQGQNSSNGIIEKYCYDDLSSNCDVFGGIYLWDELMQNSIDTINQGICPIGWRIPTDFDWKVLEGATDSQYGVGDPEWNGTWARGFDVGLNLKSTSGWFNNLNGLDLYGFNSLPAGDWDYNNGIFNYLQLYSCYFSASQVNSTNSWGRVLIYDYNESIRGNYNKGFGSSVRCIQE